MTRRPAVTLIEVLISMFIMAIGMLALLVLFPLGAVSMGQALKDDRCASTAAMAENLAIAMNIRHDPAVPPGMLVYVDPYGAIPSLGPVGGLIPRVSPSFVGGSPQLADRWFSLPDDMTFNASGTPDTVTTGGIVDRGRAYSFAYLLRPLSPSMTQLFVVVYNRRPLSVLSPEPVFPATVTSANSVQISAGTTVKRGGWILDPNGNFYRVTSIQDFGGVTTLETQQPIQGVAPGGSMIVIVMEDVAEVFDKGTSWQP